MSLSFLFWECSPFLLARGMPSHSTHPLDSWSIFVVFLYPRWPKSMSPSLFKVTLKTMALGWEWRRYESQETSLGLSFLISKDGAWARQTPRFLAILTVCGWAYGKHPVTVTIREPARCLINCKRWSGALLQKNYLFTSSLGTPNSEGLTTSQAVFIS